MGHRPKKVYKWNIKILTSLIIRMLNDKFDALICIEGKRGLGKSTLAVHLANRMHRNPKRIKNTYVFNPKKDLLYSQQDVLDAILKRWRDVFICDEMIAVTFNRDFFQDAQKKIIKALNMNRDHQNCILMCVPSFATLDTQIKNLCKMRITVTKRGQCIIHTPVKSIYARDIWDSSNNEKIEKKWIAGSNYSKPRWSRLTTFRGIMKFGDLTEKQRAIYEQIKIDKRNDIMSKENEEKTKKEDSGFARLQQMLEEGRIGDTQQWADLCFAIGKKPDTTREALNRKYRNESSPKRVGLLINPLAKEMTVQMKQTSSLIGGE